MLDDVQLLAIVEVSKEERILCRAPNCKHSVYKRIHVIKVNNTITVYGSECFKKLVGQNTELKPQFSTSIGRGLTSEERALLLENTEKLIAQFAAETLQAQTKVITTQPIPSEEISQPIPTIKPQQNNLDLWEQRQAAKESWQHKTFTRPPQPTQTSKPPIWATWTSLEWQQWAKQRLAGKAAWIDTPEAIIAWKALIATLE